MKLLVLCLLFSLFFTLNIMANDTQYAIVSGSANCNQIGNRKFSYGTMLELYNLVQKQTKQSQPSSVELVDARENRNINGMSECIDYAFRVKIVGCQKISFGSNTFPFYNLKLAPDHILTAILKETGGIPDNVYQHVGFGVVYSRLYDSKAWHRTYETNLMVQWKYLDGSTKLKCGGADLN